MGARTNLRALAVLGAPLCSAHKVCPLAPLAAAWQGASLRYPISQLALRRQLSEGRARGSSARRRPARQNALAPFWRVALASTWVLIEVMDLAAFREILDQRPQLSGAHTCTAHTLYALHKCACTREGVSAHRSQMQTRALVDSGVDFSRARPVYGGPEAGANLLFCVHTDSRAQKKAICK